jgi:hypothetical protein
MVILRAHGQQIEQAIKFMETIGIRTDNPQINQTDLYTRTRPRFWNTRRLDPPIRPNGWRLLGP